MAAETLSLEELACGALQERFIGSLQSVLENLRDRDRDYKPPRKIVIEMKFENYNEDRNSAHLSLTVKETLTPLRAVATKIGFAKRGGRMVVEEHFQMPLPDAGGTVFGIPNEERK